MPLTLHNMPRSGWIRVAGLALALYGVLGCFVALALFVVGSVTFRQVDALRADLEQQRLALVQSLRTVSRTLADTAGLADQAGQSVQGAHDAADTASQLAFNTSVSFRQMADSLNFQVFGVQPFVNVVPQFAQSADQLEQLAVTLGNTRDAIQSSSGDIGHVAADLTQLRQQIDAVATAFDRTTLFSAGGTLMLPLEVAYFGMCLLLLLQSIFSIIAGVALMRLQRTLRRQAAEAVPVVPVRPHSHEATADTDLRRSA